MVQKKPNRPIKSSSSKYEGLDVKKYTRNLGKKNIVSLNKPEQKLSKDDATSLNRTDTNIKIGSNKTQGVSNNQYSGLFETESVAEKIRKNTKKEEVHIKELKKDKEYLEKTGGDQKTIDHIQAKIEKAEKHLDKLEKKQVSKTAEIQNYFPSISPYRQSRRSASTIKAAEHQLSKNQTTLNNLYRERASLASNDNNSIKIKQLNRKIEKLEKKNTRIENVKAQNQKRLNKAEEQKRKINNLVPSNVRSSVKSVESIKNTITSKINLPMSQAKNAMLRGAKQVGSLFMKNLLAILKAIGIFLTSNPIGWVISIILIIIIGAIGYRVIIPEPELGVYDKYEEPAIYDEYRAWLEVFEEGSDEFYQDYRVVIASPQLVPIVYEFRDDEVYDKYVQEELNKATEQEKEDRTYYVKAVERYAKEMDLYALRQLFLDHVEYQYSYLHREWSPWVYGVTKEEALQHDEAYSYMDKCYRTDVIETETKDASNCWMYTGSAYDACWDASPTIVVKEEVEVEYDCEKWAYRDVLEEYWVNDPNDADRYRDTVLRPLPSVSSKNIDWEWIYYGDNGVITRKQKYWKTFGKDEVYKLVADDYNPQSEIFVGDELIRLWDEHLQSEDSRDTIRIDKRMIYKEYYSDRAGIIKENYFLEKWEKQYEENMKNYYEIFKLLNPSLDFQIASGKFLISPYLPIAQHDSGHKSISCGWMCYANHTAIDLGQNAVKSVMDDPSGELTVGAAADGTVVYVYDGCRDNGANASCLQTSQSGECYLQDHNSMGYPGNLIIIEHHILDTEGNDHVFQTRYVHIKQGSAMVSVGDIVTAGTPIATMGNSGWTQGYHTHFSVDEGGNYFNPEPYMMFDIDESPIELPGLGGSETIEE